MLRKFGTLWTTFLLLMASTVSYSLPGQAETLALANTSTWEMKSKAGRRYQIFVAAPMRPAPEQGYPVIYTLDGNSIFGTMTDAARSYGRRPYGTPALVVGIGYPEDQNPTKQRLFDLTPSVSADVATDAKTGGAEAFLDFIQEELKPEISKHFVIDPSRETLFGHSLAGLFTLYSLVNAPDAFDVFAAASPSIWFEGHFIQKPNVRMRLGPKLQLTQATPRVLITVGALEQTPDPLLVKYSKDIDPAKLKLARYAEWAQVDSAREFNDFLNSLSGISSEVVIFEDEDHGSVKFPAIARAVRFTLRPDAVRPDPAPSLEAPGAPGGIQVPTAEEYITLTPDERYDLRIRTRALPKETRQQWVDEFYKSLSAGLTYAQHRRLHEERVAMDKLHGTEPPEGH